MAVNATGQLKPERVSHTELLFWCKAIVNKVDGSSSSQPTPNRNVGTKAKPKPQLNKYAEHYW